MGENQTLVTEFLLLGFPLSPRTQMLLFGLFSLFYAFTLLGNGVILGLIWLDSRLHTPMYSFVSHLAIVDMSAASVLVGPFSSIVISYIQILRAILKIQSGEGRRKAFSTCSSHLCVVGLFYGTAIIMYVGPPHGDPTEQKKYLLLFHSLFNPMLNPLIYSLRNSDVKAALKRVLEKERTS
ncbi:PREDICTED: LOW QUALITY PROTEIN: olfactory receptor 13-like [Myotis davidii]|uniref:LOW QUALITY PROTEIN: olfactory receptor 13-like n=1 Tax=Myotis davidii TaxID=225400 RepID=UPI000767B66C|nr:PREDICTED: LOW QUALITY PROTEIN: olfactory receptor 13-like [Myotis davidii]